MTIDNLDQRMAAMQNSFNQAPAEGASQFDPPPDGDYQALVKRFDFFESKSARPQAFLKTELEIVHDTAFNGREASTVHNLEDPDKISWLKKHLKVLGADVDQLDLREIRPGSALLESLLDTPVEITIKTSDKTNKDGQPYRNVYVNRRLGDPIRTDVPALAHTDVPAPPVQPPAQGAAAHTDEPIPF